MKDISYADKIVIIDFGSQTTQLIARRIRELGVYCEIISCYKTDNLTNEINLKGIILSGGSAGSICWFQDGISDSRPQELSVVNGLAFLPYSNCPHYSIENRKALYHQLIQENSISTGYACDDLSGILFRNGQAVEFVSQSDKHNSYLVQVVNGVVQSAITESNLLLNKDALQQQEYSSLTINQKMKDLININDNSTPLNAYVSIIKKLQLNKEGIPESEINQVLNIGIEKILLPTINWLELLTALMKISMACGIFTIVMEFG